MLFDLFSYSLLNWSIFCQNLVPLTYIAITGSEDLPKLAVVRPSRLSGKNALYLNIKSRAAMENKHAQNTLTKVLVQAANEPIVSIKDIIG